MGCVFNLLIIKDLLFSVIVIIERERNLLHLPEAVDDIDVNRLLVGRCRCVVEPECFFLQREKVIGQEHCAVIHFQLPFAVWLEIAYLIGSRLVIAATHQLAAYFGSFPDFQFLGYWQRFDAERVRLLNVQAVITGGYKHEGNHDVAAHDDFICYILHIHYYIAVS